MEKKIIKIKLSKRLRAFAVILVFTWSIIFGVTADFFDGTESIPPQETTSITENANPEETTAEGVSAEGNPEGTTTERVSAEGVSAEGNPEETTTEEASVEENAEETTEEETSTEENEENEEGEEPTEESQDENPEDIYNIMGLSFDLLSTGLSGTGTELDPYIIAAPEDLLFLVSQVNSGTASYNGEYIKLTDNIDISDCAESSFNSGKGWIPIGTNTNMFEGIFDGGGNIITGLYINDNSLEYAGLFGYVSGGGIENLSVENMNITAKTQTGGLAGYINSAVISQCNTSGTVKGTGTSSVTGGLAGSVNNSSVTKSYSECEVISTAYAGGLIGYLNGVSANVSITQCYSSGNVAGTIYTGGISGFIHDGNVNITDCYSTGNIEGIYYVGGISGYAYGGDISIANCYSAGSIESANYQSGIGGILGYINDELLTVTNCAALNPQINGTGENAGRIVGAKGASAVWTLSANRGYSMLLDGAYSTTWSEKFVNGKDGTDMNEEQIASASFWMDTINWTSPGWDTSVWSIVNNKLPVLTDVGEQDGIIPAHIPPYDPGVTSLEGNGILGDEYLIHTPEELDFMAKMVNMADATYGAPGKYYKLMDDIDISGYNIGVGWRRIGFNQTYPFKGIFDGNGHKVSGLYIYDTMTDYVGLFGCIENGTVKNLGVTNININARGIIGGIAGMIRENVTVSKCYTKGVIMGGAETGGIVGYAANGSGTAGIVIEQCYSTCSVTGSSNSNSNYFGGIIGRAIPANSFGIIVRNCYSSVAITSSGNGIGGILGSSQGTTTIQLTNCYSTGEIKSTEPVNAYRAGGIAGEYSSGTLRITNCAALNNKISAVTANRISGTASNLVNNYAFSGILDKNDTSTAWTPAGTLTNLNGKNMTSAQISSTAFWTTAANWNTSAWDASVWSFEEDKLPVLIDLDGQDGTIPNYLKSVTDSLRGSGTSSDPFRIYTPQDLEFMAKMVNANTSPYNNATTYYQLMNNIDISMYGAGYNGGNGWTPIGSNTNPFKAIFNGENYEISGLYINNSTLNYAGLFGVISAGTVKNVGVTDINVVGQNYVGGLVGEIRGTLLSYTYTKGSVSGTSYVGGIAGYINNAQTTIEKSYSKCTVTAGASGSAGGIVGNIYGSNNVTIMVMNCYSTGDVTGGTGVGGIAGNTNSSISMGNLMVQYCYSTGVITGTTSVGGIVGLGSTGNVNIQVYYCAALNPKVSGTSAGRIRSTSGGGGSGNTMGSNRAYSELLNKSDTTSWPDKNSTGRDGADMSAEQAVTPSFWSGSMSWNCTGVWICEDGKLPVLRNLPGQNGKWDSGGDDSEISLSESGTYIFPTLEFGYTEDDFVFEHYKVIQVTNKSADETGAIKITLSGANANAFTVNTMTLDSIAAAEWFEEADPDNERTGWTYSSAAFTISPRTGLAVNPPGTYYTATVTVTPSNSKLSPKSFTVRFVVKEPAYAITISPSKAYQFPSAEKNYGAAWAEQNKLPVTVKNETSSNTGLLDIVLSGKDASDFEISQTTINNIAGNGTFTFTVKPKAGLADGVHNALLTVRGTDVKSQTLNLIFTVHTPNITHVESYLIDETDEKSVGMHEWTNILNKSAKKVDEDRFELTMSVKGSQIVPPVRPAIVVMILDTSGSMNDNPGGSSGNGGSNSKIASMKNVAGKFAYDLLSASPSNYLALASFASDGKAHKRSNGTYFYHDKGEYSYVTDAINRLQAVGATNTQGGLLAAYKILREGLTEIPQSIRDEAEYYIILMSDGGANYYYTLGDSSISGSYLLNWNRSPGASYYTVSNINSALNGVRLAGGNYGIGGSGNGAATGHPDPEDGAQNAALDARRLILGTLGAGTPPTVKPNIYTVGFDLKSERMTTKLAEFATNSQYVFHANNTSALSDVYTQIAHQLTSPTIDSGSIITDKLSKYFEFDSDWFVSASIGSVTYGSAANAGATISGNTLEWVLGQVITKDITASITFRIKAKPEAYSNNCDNSEENGIIPTNGEAKLKYWNKLKQKQGNENNPYEAEFTSPTVHVQDFTLIIDKEVFENPYISDYPETFTPESLSGDWVKLAAFNELDRRAVFKITVTNNTAIAANGVMLSDIFEKSGTPGAITGGFWYGGNPTTTPFNIPPNNSAIFYYITEPLTDTGAYANTAAIIPGAYEGGGNSSSAGVTVTEAGEPEQPPILSIDKSVYIYPYISGTSPLPGAIPANQWAKDTTFMSTGETALFKITVKNNSITTSATGVMIKDTLMKGAAEMTGGQWIGAVNPTMASFGIPPGGIMSFYYVSPTLSSTGEYKNTASIVEDPAERYLDDGNPPPETTVTVIAKPMLSIDKKVYKFPYEQTVMPDSISAGDWISSATFTTTGKNALFKITIENSSETSAAEVKITDVLEQSGMPLSGGTWYAGNTPVDPTQDTFAVAGKVGGVNGSVTFYYITGNLAKGIYVNTASILPNSMYSLGNSSAMAMVTVNVPTLKISKKIYEEEYDIAMSPDPGSLDSTKWVDATVFESLNKHAVFKITIENSSTAAAAGIKIADMLKKNGVEVTGGTWYNGNTPVNPTETPFGIPGRTGGVNGTVTFYYISAPLSTSGTYINTATITGDDRYEIITGNGENEASVTVDLGEGPKLPETGGSGMPRPLTACWIIIMTGAAGILMYRKKVKSAKSGK